MTNVSLQKQNNKVQISEGNVPPQDMDLEEKIIGTILNNSEMLIDVEHILFENHFYSEVNKLIYRAIVSLSRASVPIDSSTVFNEVKRQGNERIVGGFLVIAEIENKKYFTKSQCPTLEFHARVIIQHYMRRELIRNSQDTIINAYDPTVDVFDLVESHDKGVFNIMSETQKKESSSMDDLMNDFSIEITKPKKSDGITGIPSGYKELDEITGGWQRQDLIILAARPSMGKTAFALQLAKNAAERGSGVVIFSLEMSKLSLTYRFVSSDSDIQLARIMKKQLMEPEYLDIYNSMSRLRNLPIHIDDSSLNIYEFRAKCRRLKAQYNIQMIVVDYLQLMSGFKNDGKITMNRDAEIGSITKTLKSVAKELDIPVIALSQLSRAVDSRPGMGKRPLLSDLRESGNIEQDADIVMFLHRPEYYKIVEDEQGRSLIGMAENIIAKHRNGVCDTIPLKFNGSKMKFSDWEWPSLIAEPKEDNKIEVQSHIEFDFDDDQDPPF